MILRLFSIALLIAPTEAVICLLSVLIMLDGIEIFETEERKNSLPIDFSLFIIIFAISAENIFLDLKPVIVYSMWNGYLDSRKTTYNKEWDDFLKEQWRNGARVVHLHTSGHADPDTIAKAIKAISPRNAIYPIHTENSAGFFALDIPQENVRVFLIPLLTKL
ncbi:MAG: MBL fold metallo-hydrolase RNA specificity domain-containing protein [Oscillospiraceae bacterium]